MKKRRNNLLDMLDNAISGNSGSTSRESNSIEPAVVPPTVPEASLRIVSNFEREFRKALDDLHEHHIFQWSTFYLDCLTKYFDRFVDTMTHPSSDELFEVISRPLADHTHVAFSKGYEYVHARSTSEPPDSLYSREVLNHENAIKKSINGLSRFLALPLDFYSARLSGVSGYRSTFVLRALVSAAVSGVLDGYSRVQFGRQSGREILPRWQRQWVPYMAFLTPHNAERVADSLEGGALQDGLNLSMLPLLDALQRFFERENDDYWPIPVTGQYSWHRRRVSISIRPPQSAASQRLIEIGAFLEEGFVETEDLNDAVRRRMALVLAPLRPDVRKIVDDREALRAVVVPVSPTSSDTKEGRKRSRVAAADWVYRRLDDTLYSLRSKLEAKAPITYNFASEFPLHEPHKAQFFHVARTSVRDLLRTFERRNGIRLWCSVRRSGKTTACLDMETTTGESSIIGQTCGASQVTEAVVFYRRVRDSVASGRMVPETFVKEVISECAQIDFDGRRTVLIIDEYETFFGLLRNAARDDVATRTSVPRISPIVSIG